MPPRSVRRWSAENTSSVSRPLATTEAECVQLFNLAEQNHLILMDSIKTAYSTAYNRLLPYAEGRKDQAHSLRRRHLHQSARRVSLRGRPRTDLEQHL